MSDRPYLPRFAQMSYSSSKEYPTSSKQSPLSNCDSSLLMSNHVEEFECDRLLELQYSSIKSNPASPNLSHSHRPRSDAQTFRSSVATKRTTEYDKCQRWTTESYHDERSKRNTREMSHVLSQLNHIPYPIASVRNHIELWREETPGYVNDELLSYFQNPVMSQGFSAFHYVSTSNEKVSPEFPPVRPIAPNPLARDRFAVEEENNHQISPDNLPKRPSHFKPISPVLDEVLIQDMLSSFSSKQNLNYRDSCVRPKRIRPIPEKTILKCPESSTIKEDRRMVEGAETKPQFEDSYSSYHLKLSSDKPSLRLISGNTLLPRGERSAFHCCSKDPMTDQLKLREPLDVYSTPMIF